MLLTTLRTAAAVAEHHGEGIHVILGGVEWSLVQLTVHDRPEGLEICEGYTSGGDLIVFNAQEVELVRIPADKAGRKAALPRYRGE